MVLGAIAMVVVVVVVIAVVVISPVRQGRDRVHLLVDRIGIEQARLPDHVLEGAEPVHVIGVRLLRVARLPGGDACDEALTERLPGKAALLVEADGHPEGAALTRLLEDELAVAAG